LDLVFEFVLALALVASDLAAAPLDRPKGARRNSGIGGDNELTDASVEASVTWAVSQDMDDL